MNSLDPSFSQIAYYVFPKEVLRHFTITNIQEITPANGDDVTLEIILEEQNSPPVIPEEHRGKPIHSKGFNRDQLIQHFPLQDKLCILRVRTRHWSIEDVGIVRRKLSFLPQKGLKVTTDFGAFLKEADRTRAGGNKTHRETLWNKEIGENV